MPQPQQNPHHHYRHPQLQANRTMRPRLLNQNYYLRLLLILLRHKLQ
jgi:hypothetical protein